MKRLTEDERAILDALFDRGAAKVRVFDAYWINGADSGEDYCLRCARKEVAALRKKASAGEKEEIFVDGGWRTEHDSQPLCYKCGRTLDGSFTNHAARDEMEHFSANGFNPKSADDCYSMSEVVNTTGWDPWSERVYQREYERERDELFFAGLNELGRKILDGLSAQHKASLKKSMLSTK